jgi:hypothetical protein
MDLGWTAGQLEIAGCCFFTFVHLSTRVSGVVLVADYSCWC